MIDRFQIQRQRTQVAATPKTDAATTGRYTPREPRAQKVGKVRETL